MEESVDVPKNTLIQSKGSAIGKRFESLHKQIMDEYPELLANRFDKPVNFSEVVRAYYELKAMESQRKRDWVIVALTLVNLALTAINLYLTFRK